jgi:hypothetical protein
LQRAPKQTNRTAHRHRPRPIQTQGHRERQGSRKQRLQSNTMGRTLRRRDRAAGAVMDLSLPPARTELLHTTAGTAYAELRIDDYRERWPIRSRRFRAFLRRFYYETTGTAASAVTINMALDQLEARAQFDGPSNPSTCGSRNMESASISISLIPTGERSRSRQMAGGAHELKGALRPCKWNNQ